MKIMKTQTTSRQVWSFIQLKDLKIDEHFLITDFTKIKIFWNPECEKTARAFDGFMKKALNSFSGQINREFILKIQPFVNAYNFSSLRENLKLPMINDKRLIRDFHSTSEHKQILRLNLLREHKGIFQQYLRSGSAESFEIANLSRLAGDNLSCNSILAEICLLSKNNDPNLPFSLDLIKLNWQLEEILLNSNFWPESLLL